MGDKSENKPDYMQMQHISEGLPWLYSVTKSWLQLKVNVSCVFQALTDVATTVAQTLFLQAGGEASQLPRITADSKIVRNIIYIDTDKTKHAATR